MSNWQSPASDADGDGGIKVSGGLIGGGIAGLVLVIFVLQNTTKVRISFLFWTFTTPMFFALILAAGLTLVAERLVGWGLVRRRRKRQRAE